jgi:tRNA(Ile)-lysidine synthetase-like protein
MMEMNHEVLAAMPKTIAVAWSGGADSTALALQLKDLGFEVQLWHVDHGWHDNSADVALDLKAKALVWGVPFELRCIKKSSNNVESEARKGRYHAFAEIAKATQCYHLALGHHADDQAETVCMRLLQGAGVAGCCGMKTHRIHGDVHLWRPLLTSSRQSIEYWLHDRKETWWNDPSNIDTKLWRNKIRHQLFPAMKAHGSKPEVLFMRWQKQAELLQHHIAALAEGIEIKKWRENDIQVCEISWQDWSEHSRSIRAYILQQLIGQLFGDGRVFGRRHIQAIEAWRKQGGNGWLNLSGCCLYREEEGLQLCQGKVSLRHEFSKKRAS